MSFDHFGFISPLYARVKYSELDTLREMMALPATGGKLLDVGGGTGRVSLAVRDLVDMAIVCDVSMGMLNKTHRARLLPVRGGSETLPFPGNFFERVIMVDALHHVADHAQTAREMFRVLKPGGRIVIEEPDIKTFGVKLIALMEKALIMRSHFLEAKQIAALFPPATANIHTKDSTVWIVVEKAGHV